MRTKSLVATFAAVAALAIGIGVVGVSADHGGGTRPVPYPPSSPSVVVSNSTPKVGSKIKVWYNGCLAGATATFTLGSETRTKTVKTSIRYEKDYTVYVELKVPNTTGPYTGTVTCSSGASDTFSITVVSKYTCIVGVPSTKDHGGGECDRALLDALMKKYDWLVV